MQYMYCTHFFLGSTKRYRTKAIQTSKHCNIICMYTTFTTTDGNQNKAFADNMEAQNTGVTHYVMQIHYTRMLSDNCCQAYFRLDRLDLFDLNVM